MFIFSFSSENDINFCNGEFRDSYGTSQQTKRKKIKKKTHKTNHQRNTHNSKLLGIE